MLIRLDVLVRQELWVLEHRVLGLDVRLEDGRVGGCGVVVDVLELRQLLVLEGGPRLRPGPGATEVVVRYDLGPGARVVDGGRGRAVGEG